MLILHFVVGHTSTNTIPFCESCNSHSAISVSNVADAIRSSGSTDWLCFVSTEWLSALLRFLETSRTAILCWGMTGRPSLLVTFRAVSRLPVCTHEWQVSWERFHIRWEYVHIVYVNSIRWKLNSILQLLKGMQQLCIFSGLDNCVYAEYISEAKCSRNSTQPLQYIDCNGPYFIQVYIEPVL